MFCQDKALSHFKLACREKPKYEHGYWILLRNLVHQMSVTVCEMGAHPTRSLNGYHEYSIIYFHELGRYPHQGFSVSQQIFSTVIMTLNYFFYLSLELFLDWYTVIYITTS